MSNNDFDDIDDFLGFLEYLEDLEIPQNRPRIIVRPRKNPLETLDDSDFFERYRVSKEAFLFNFTKLMKTWSMRVTGGVDAELFRNSKGYFSVNVQMVSDAQTRVLNVVARWPGSTHNSAIFTNSTIYSNFESGLYKNNCLLGDSGYPLKEYLLTPYMNPRTVAEENYNTSHLKTRNTVERQYDIIKRRFPALAYGLRIKLDTAIDVIISCCILHNICIQFKENVPVDQFNTDIQNLIEEGQINHNANDQNDGRGIDKRALLTYNYFN